MTRRGSSVRLALQNPYIAAEVDYVRSRASERQFRRHRIERRLRRGAGRFSAT
jgi:hypothetical protein